MAEHRVLLLSVQVEQEQEDVHMCNSNEGENDDTPFPWLAQCQPSKQVHAELILLMRTLTGAHTDFQFGAPKQEYHTTWEAAEHESN
jgi:hypothetical protein